MSALITVEIILAILFSLSVLLQDKGSGLSLTFGGDGSNTTFYGSKQGLEKFLDRASHILAVLFVLNSIILTIQS